MDLTVTRERVDAARASSESLMDRQARLLLDLRAHRGSLRTGVARVRTARTALASELAGARSSRRGPVGVCPGAGVAAERQSGPGGAGGSRFARPERGIQEMAEIYTRTRAPKLRAAVVAECMEWSARLAGAVARGSGADQQDLAQVASLAVARALERYDPSVGDFEPFARATVAGEVRHHLRATVWSVRVPRRYQEAHRAVARARDELTAELRAEPTLDQLAAATGLDRDSVAAVAGLLRQAASLDGPGAADGAGSGLSAPDPHFEAVLDRVDLALAMRSLDGPQRRLLGLYFFGDNSQRGVAGVLGSSQIQVSRKLNRALSQLRARMEA